MTVGGWGIGLNGLVVKRRTGWIVRGWHRWVGIGLDGLVLKRRTG
ncbi:hypothetical protein OHA74_23975 [Streptomyces phaeochromogenes]|nr:hypothetical protein [Streptomyces phaeochromogenes]